MCSPRIALVSNSPVTHLVVNVLDSQTKKDSIRRSNKEKKEPKRSDKYAAIIHHVLNGVIIAPMLECQSSVTPHAFQKSVLLSRGALGRTGRGAYNLPQACISLQCVSTAVDALLAENGAVKSKSACLGKRP